MGAWPRTSHDAPLANGVSVIASAPNVLWTQVRLAGGCAAFPFVWDSQPGYRYGNRGDSGESGFSREMRVTILCAKGATIGGETAVAPSAKSAVANRRTSTAEVPTWTQQICLHASRR